MVPRRRDIFLRIETLPDYSPLAPIPCSRRYGRDCMLNEGHESGRLTPEEILEARVDALVYREYLDPHYRVPNEAPIVGSDVNEPPWDRRIPGAVLYAEPGERLYIHVENGDREECHSLHMHGLEYAIDSDGAWPLGVRARDGGRSDEILPGQRWTYVFDVTPKTIGAWPFHDHVRHVQTNVNRGLFGAMIVRDPNAPRAHHEVPLILHELEGTGAQCSFESPSLSQGQTFAFTFSNEGQICRYYCRIHGPTMSGRVRVAPGGPATATVAASNNRFDPQDVEIGPGGTVTWRNDDESRHIVFAGGGSASTFCINGRAYVGNTPTVVAEAGERIRWYLLNLDAGGVWHNVHPHAARWEIPSPPGGGSDVHPLSPLEARVIDTEAPPALRLPRELEDLQHARRPDACLVRLKGDFLIHCHIEEHMMGGLAGLVRARQRIWVTEEVLGRLDIDLPYDDGTNDCAHVDTRRCGPPKHHPSHQPPDTGDQPHPDAPGHHPEPPGPPVPAPTGPEVIMVDHEHEGGHSGPVLVPSPAPADIAEAPVKGLWELLVCELPILAVHAALMRTGKVLFFAGSGNDELISTGLRTVVWDYQNGSFHAPATPIDLFCAGQSFLADGRLLVAGGTERYDTPETPFIGLRTAFVFDPILEEWFRVQDMVEGRWYPTLVTLGDGRVLAVSGGTTGPTRNELFSYGSGWAAPSENRFQWPLYPGMTLLADGRVFFSGQRQSGSPMSPGYLDPATDGFTPLPDVAVPADFQLGSRTSGGTVLLPPAQDQRVMVIGGGEPDAIPDVHIIDLSAPDPAYAAAPSLAFSRVHLNAVLLPDRTVLVCGGSGLAEKAHTAALEAEIYDPATNTWTVGASARVPRLYHSIGLLLPDGRVITAGSNPQRRDDELRLELYHPPYLFRGPRPFIERAPGKLRYGESFTIHTPNARDIAWVHLIRPMATTHSMETEQRLVELAFFRDGACSLSAELTGEANLAPPGWYLVFIVNRDRVPSVGRWVHLAR
ncbi:MAG: galactose oxidase-like domain-containing protein [Actinomycetota bacterium]